jgi:hypothetical protein
MRVARLREREPHRKETGRAGAEQDGFCRGSRGVLRSAEPSRAVASASAPATEDPYPGHEYERRDIGCPEGGDRPRCPLGKSDARDDDPAERTYDHTPSSQAGVVGRISQWI